jgi:hypothetical protein
LEARRFDLIYCLLTVHSEILLFGRALSIQIVALHAPAATPARPLQHSRNPCRLMGVRDQYNLRDRPCDLQLNVIVSQAARQTEQMITQTFTELAHSWTG